MKVFSTVRVLVAMVVCFASSRAQTYRSVRISNTGQLSLKLSSGKTIKAPLLRDQAAFGEAMLSRDHRTAGWFAEYPDNGDAQGSGSDQIPGRLVLYRAGRILRSFGTEQIFWSWRFLDRDRQVAFCTGPAHGGASACELHRLDSGLLVAQWEARAEGKTPVWTKGLRY